MTCVIDWVLNIESVNRQTGFECSKQVYQQVLEGGPGMQSEYLSWTRFKDCCLTMLTKLYENAAKSVFQTEAEIRACAEGLTFKCRMSTN